MLVKKAKTIKLIYGLAFAITSLALAFLLILQVCDIYFNGGSSPFTVAVIREHFTKILIPIIFWALLLIGGFIVWGILPIEKKAYKNDVYYTYSCLKKKIESEPVSCDENNYKEYAKRQEKINVVKFICGLCVCICIAFSLAFILDKSNFTNLNQNLEVAKTAIYLLPFTLVSFGLVIGVAIFEKAMIKKQMPLAKTILKDKSGASDIVKTPIILLKNKITKFLDNKKTISSLRIAVAIIGVGLLVFGLATGGNAGVLAKAVNICRQCIGLG